jgi:hypothetical protein
LIQSRTLWHRRYACKCSLIDIIIHSYSKFHRRLTVRKCSHRRCPCKCCRHVKGDLLYTYTPDTSKETYCRLITYLTNLPTNTFSQALSMKVLQTRLAREGIVCTYDRAGMIIGLFWHVSWFLLIHNNGSLLACEQVSFDT